MLTVLVPAIHQGLERAFESVLVHDRFEAVTVSAQDLEVTRFMILVIAVNVVYVQLTKVQGFKSTVFTGRVRSARPQGFFSITSVMSILVSSRSTFPLHTGATLAVVVRGSILLESEPPCLHHTEILVADLAQRPYMLNHPLAGGSKLNITLLFVVRVSSTRATIFTQGYTLTRLEGVNLTFVTDRTQRASRC